jgi:hypothetical protein
MNIKRLMLLLVVVIAAPFAFAATPSACPAAPPRVDGNFSLGEYAGAAQYSLDVNLPGRGTVPATLYITNDGTNVYLALRFARTYLDNGNGLAVSFDANRSGVLDAGDDLIGLSYSPWSGTTALDGVYFAGGRNCAPDTLCSGPDEEHDNGLPHVNAAFGWNGASATYEISHPIWSGDADDVAFANLQPTRFNLQLRLWGQDNQTYADTEWPDNPSSGTWAEYTAARCDQ